MENSFSSRVEELVSRIPEGRVMTYGQLAAMTGNAKAARIVGGIAHFGDPNLPWQRVVNKTGGLASGYPGGRESHKIHLESEGIEVAGNEGNYFVDVVKLLWQPGSNLPGYAESRMESPNIKQAQKLESIFIVGPTASGKSSLSLKIALKYSGEIICADSRTVYKGLDIGTAKPSVKDQKLIHHYGLDLAKPSDYFTAKDFVFYANQKIVEIQNRGNLPIIVGGSGLYIDALLFGYKFRNNIQPKLRTELKKLSHDDLIGQASVHKKLTSDDLGNRRRLIRIIETQGQKSEKSELRPSVAVIGLTPPKEELLGNIKERVDKMLELGVLEEAKNNGEKYGWECEALSGNIYPVLKELLNRNINLENAKSEMVKRDLKLVKKQLTWFKRHDFIHWFSEPTAAEEFISLLLQN